VRLAELAKELEAGQVRPAYLVAGEEPLLRDDALVLIRAAVLGDDGGEFNLDRFDGVGTSPQVFEEALGALPVFAARRLVVLSEPDAGRKSALSASLAERLPDHLAQDETVLVVKAAKVDRRKAWVKAFAKPAAVVECDPPRKGRELVAFVKEEAAKQGVAIEARAAQRLAEHVGPQLLVLRQEIDKAALLAGEGNEIKSAHVEAGVVTVADQPIWDLTDAIGEGRSADAIGLLSQMLAGGAPGPVVLASLATHFRRLARVRSGERAAGPPFVARKLEAQARRYAPARILACLGAIHRADVALKGGSVLAPELALEQLVLGLSA